MGRGFYMKGRIKEGKSERGRRWAREIHSVCRKEKENKGKFVAPINCFSLFPFFLYKRRRVG